MNENMKVKWFDEEIEVYDEKRVVSKSTSTITLNYIPSKTRPLTVENKGVMLTETEGTPSENQYVADRENGLLLFNSVMNGKVMVINYAAVGQWCINAEKVYTNTDNKGNVIETLEELIEENRSAIESIKTIGDGAKVVQEMQGAIDSVTGLVGNIIEGENINNTLVSTISTARTTNSNLTNATIVATNKINEMNTWVNSHGDIVDLDNRVENLDLSYNKIANEDIPKINSSLETMVKQNIVFKPYGNFTNTDKENKYEAWTFGNHFYDLNNNKFCVVYNSKSSHTSGDGGIYFATRKDDEDYYTCNGVISSKEGKGVVSHGANILPNGCYMAIAKVCNNGIVDTEKCIILESYDAGLTWSERDLVVDNELYIGDGFGDLYVCKNGRVLMFARDKNSIWNQRYYIIYSDNNGLTWTKFKLTNALIESNRYCMEGKFVQLGDNTLACIIRADLDIPTKKTSALIIYSYDEGLTWTNIIESTLEDMSANNCAILETSDNIYEIIYCSRTSKKMFKCIASGEDIKNNTFKKPTVMLNGTGDGNFGYPSMAKNSNGEIDLLYYSFDGEGTNINLLRGSLGNAFVKREIYTHSICDEFKIESEDLILGTLTDDIGVYAEHVDSVTRLVTKNFIKIEKNYYFIINNNREYDINIRQFSNGLNNGETGFINNDFGFFKNENTTHIKIIFKKNNDTYISTSIDCKKIKLTLSDSTISCLSLGVPKMFENGSISYSYMNTPTLTTSTTRIRSKMYSFVSPGLYKISINDGYKINVRQFNYNYTNRFESGFINNDYIYISDTTTFIKYIIAKTDDSNINISDISNIEFTLKKEMFKSEECFLLEGYQNIFKTGGYNEVLKKNSGSSTAGNYIGLNIANSIANDDMIGRITNFKLPSNITKIKVKGIINNNNGGKLSVRLYSKNNPSSSGDGRIRFVELNTVGNFEVEIESGETVKYLCIVANASVIGSNISASIYEISAN